MQPAAAREADGVDARAPGGGRLVAIDALRGFAICWVVLYHIWTDIRFPNVYPAQGDAFRAAGSRLLEGDLAGFATGAGNAFLRVGYLGVPLFMLLSGLSLTLSAARRGPSLRWRGFMTRRFRRVMVPYWFGFALTVAFALALACVQWQRHGGGYAGYVRHGDIPIDGGQLLAGALVLPRILRDSWQFAPEGSLWFVLVILQYYLLFPLLLPLLSRLGPLPFAGATLLFTWLALGGMATAAGGLHEHGTWVEMAAPFRLFEFTAGMSLGALLARRPHMRVVIPPAAIAPLIAGGITLFVGACLIDEQSRWQATLQGPAIVLAFLLVAAPPLLGPPAQSPETRAPARAAVEAAVRIVAWAGPVSYTILIISEPLRSVTHTMSAERAPDAAILAWVFAGMIPITLLAARPLALALGLIDRPASPVTMRDIIGAPHTGAAAAVPPLDDRPV